MNQFIGVLLFCLCITATYAQNNEEWDEEPSPRKGIHALGDAYLEISFSERQEMRLVNRTIELTLAIDVQGGATLKEVKGIRDREIIALFVQKTRELEPFQPGIKNGFPEPSTYILILTFGYEVDPEEEPGELWDEWDTPIRFTDFASIERSNLRVDFLLSGGVSQLTGNIANHLGIGGGARIGFSLVDKKKFTYGFYVNGFDNSLRSEYPISTLREHKTNPFSMFMGASFGKWFNNFGVQAELGRVIHQVTEPVGEDDPLEIRWEGWSPGFILQYALPLGRETIIREDSNLSLAKFNINLHAGCRYMGLPVPQAQGFMLEFGLGIRMNYQRVRDYKFAELEFL